MQREPRTEAGRLAAEIRRVARQWLDSDRGVDEARNAMVVIEYDAEGILAIEQEAAALNPKRLARALHASRDPIINGDGQKIGFTSATAERIATEYARLSLEDSVVPQGADHE